MKIPWFETELDIKERTERENEKRRYETDNWHKVFTFWPKKVNGGKAVCFGYVMRKRVSYREADTERYGKVSSGTYVYKTVEQAVKEKIEKAASERREDEGVGADAAKPGF